MKTEKLNELLELVERKINLDKKGIGKGADPLSAFKHLKEEIDEAIDEYNDKKQVYLEDELGDVLWTICRIILTMDNENSIDKTKVFDRAIKKYLGRIEGLEQGKTWEEVKKVQKAELLQEQTDLENK